MPDRLILIDTDMVVLLGGSGSLPDALQSLEFAPAQARRLAAATAQLQRGKAFKDNYTAVVLQAALRASPRDRAAERAAGGCGAARQPGTRVEH